jgi:hypothetical protein
MTVWLGAATLTYPQAGGHFWVFLNWALGLRALGCEVVWLEYSEENIPVHRREPLLTALRKRLASYGLANSVATDLEGAEEADLLLNLSYSNCAAVLDRFRRTAMLDIDPGLLQVWMAEGTANIPRHDIYFTTGETVGQPGAKFSDGGLKWAFTPPCVALDAWPVTRATADAPFTTVTHWWSKDWFNAGGEQIRNDKRSGFLPYFDLPRHTRQPLELALCLEADANLKLLPHEAAERDELIARGWQVQHAHAVAGTPQDYQKYIQQSRGEFSCVKPSCVLLQNAWISDRSLCYLASGKPVIVQHTGPSRLLPDDDGIFRFHDLDGAVRCLEKVAADYDEQCRRARALAEEHFDAYTVVASVLERAL